ncbi:DUF4145 domain-containing protein [Rhizobium sp. TH2]|uniref:DUF4145 domain-containing protein n=1 Tax=Rhizobium sp. TH2 TaxID=2775403 RepID=UPI0021575061|nr:DUF4145 domain-containing protein [Rhizobium sp. TH2]UVC07371.1 DUF4145 domain-containing protein [Rhizobium sp. TH2]
MALLVLTCPHCLTAKSGMPLFGVRSFPYEAAISHGIDRSQGGEVFSWDISVSAICQVCFKPVSAVLRPSQKMPKNYYKSTTESTKNVLLGEGNVRSLGYAVLESWPTVTESAIPDHLSENVAKTYRSAERNFSTPDGEDAAAMLYRRAIDVAIREKHPEITGLLAVRISKLAGKGLLPPSMKEWADQIRLIGNDGAHEPEGVTMDDLKPMRGFTEAFLRYFITIPFEVSCRRGEIDDEGNLLLVSEQS